MWRRQCGSARDHCIRYWKWPGPVVPSPRALGPKTWGSGARTQPGSPLAHLPAARGFPGTRLRNTGPANVDDHPPSAQRQLRSSWLQQQPRVGLMVRGPPPGADLLAGLVPRPDSCPDCSSWPVSLVSSPSSLALESPGPRPRRGLLQPRPTARQRYRPRQATVPAGGHHVSCRQHPRTCAASRPSTLVACRLGHGISRAATFLILPPRAAWHHAAHDGARSCS